MVVVGCLAKAGTDHLHRREKDAKGAPHFLRLETHLGSSSLG